MLNHSVKTNALLAAMLVFDASACKDLIKGERMSGLAPARNIVLRHCSTWRLELRSW